MALKPDRHESRTDLSYFMNATATRGVILIHNTGGSGAAMDTANATVAVPTVASGTNPAGLLLNDVVNLDLTRQHINFHKDEVQQGSKVLLLREGWVVTNTTSGTPTVGAPAFYNNEGQLTTVAVSDDLLNDERYKVGRFLSIPDADGYVKVEILIR